MFKELKKYKTWWLISLGIFTYFFLNLVMFAVFGFSFATPSSTAQGIVQFVVIFTTFFSTLIPYLERGILK